MADNTQNTELMSIGKDVHGKVNINLQLNHLQDKDNYFGRVESNMLEPANAVHMMRQKLPSIDEGIMLTVVNSFLECVGEGIKAGYGFKMGNLGHYYLASRGTVELDGEKPRVSVGYTVSKELRDMAKDVEVRSAEVRNVEGRIDKVTDIASGLSNGTLTEGGACLIEGLGLKITGEGSGIWFAPVAENGGPSPDEAMWIKIESALIENTPSRLLFTLSSSLVVSKSYCIIIRTHIASGGYIVKELVQLKPCTITMAASS